MQYGGLRLKAKPPAAKNRVFPFFEAFSFLLDDGNGCVRVSQKTMKAFPQSLHEE
jgi:hypothetical protein